MDKFSNVRAQVFEVMAHSELRKHFLLFPLQQESLNIVRAAILHKMFAVEQQIEIVFREDYPDGEPLIKFTSEEENCDEIDLRALAIENVRRRKLYTLVGILEGIIEVFDAFWHSQQLFSENLCNQSLPPIAEKIGMEDTDYELISSKMNSIFQVDSSANKNECDLIRFFRQKIREVLHDLVQAEPDNERWRQIEAMLSARKIGLEGVRKLLLANQQLRVEISRQMSNGEFLNKILQGLNGIKSKKILIKNYSIMMRIINNPDEFVNWRDE